MVIKIHHHFLKLVAQEFLHLVPVMNNVKLEVGQIVEMESERYGKLGQVEVLGFYETHVYELKDTVVKLADGHSGSQQLLMADHGVNSLRVVQVCRLCFKRRRDDAFRKMLDKELPKAGLELTRQGEMQF